MDQNNNRNFIAAIALSIAVLTAWQFFYTGPRMREEQLRQQRAAEATQTVGQDQTATATAGSPGTAATGTAGSNPQLPGEAAIPQPGAASTGAPSSPNAIPGSPAFAVPRESILAQSPRIVIDSPAIRGSIALKGGRIDDIILKRYRETIDRDSGNVTLLSPAGSANPYYAEYGWVPGASAATIVPGRDTLWRAEGAQQLTPVTPVKLSWDNGQGIVFRREIAIDDNYMLTVTQTVENKSSAAVTLYPYALVSRHGRPYTEEVWVLHEGLLGVLGEEGLKKLTYGDAIDDRINSFKATGGWVGITDKYWGVTLVPEQKSPYEARFTGNADGGRERFQVDYLLDARTIAPGTNSSVTAHLFSGAKRVELIDAYEENLGIKQFELLIDWGWFYYITKLLFKMMDFFYKLVGNFGVAILLTTVVVKALFFPLANKSYVSMSKMKILQPEMKRIQERYKDDKARQQQALMELYKKEKVNPMSGCLPILLQIPVFFALYKVLYVTIEMRHAPFFGWIQDLSVKDPTSLFNLFGLIPFSVPDILVIGVLPIIMGITMWLQMKLNPTPPDPVQQKIFAYMPLIFTFILAPFPAGLVIYWTWNNVLSIAQQWYIMKRQGAKVELMDNLKETFAWVANLTGRGGSGDKGGRT